jgi:hypothetical protein
MGRGGLVDNIQTRDQTFYCAANQMTSMVRVAQDWREDQPDGVG